MGNLKSDIQEKIIGQFEMRGSSATDARLPKSEADLKALNRVREYFYHNEKYTDKPEIEKQISKGMARLNLVLANRELRVLSEPEIQVVKVARGEVLDPVVDVSSADATNGDTPIVSNASPAEYAQAIGTQAVVLSGGIRVARAVGDGFTTIGSLRRGIGVIRTLVSPLKVAKAGFHGLKNGLVWEIQNAVRTLAGVPETRPLGSLARGRLAFNTVKGLFNPLKLIRTVGKGNLAAAVVDIGATYVEENTNAPAAVKDGASLAKWTANGAAAGAVIGSVVPVIGTAVGAGVGAGLGAVGNCLRFRKIPFTNIKW